MGEIAISADGVPIHYEVHGHQVYSQSTPALVFVHGWCCDRSYWHKQVEHFARQYTVIAVDLAGHGESGLNRDAWTMPAFGQDVVAVVDQLHLTQVVLIGHSMGGPVIIEAARHIPGQVIGLVGVETFLNLERTRTKEQLEAMIAPLRINFQVACRELVRANMFVTTSEAAFVEAIVEDMAAAPSQVSIGAAEQLFSHDAEVRAGLHAIQAPISVINAEYHPTNIEAARRYGIKVELMSGAGHFIMMEAPTRFNHLLEETIKQFFAALPRARYP